MTRFAISCFALVLGAGIVTAGQAAPAFDAVSIREARSGAASAIRAHPSGLAATSATVLELIQYAFEVIPADVVGELPGWATTRRFDVVARTSSESLTYSRVRQMTRALLQDRFQLDAAFDRVEAPVYALVMERADGKIGPNLRPSTSTCVVDPVVKEPPTQPVAVLTVTSCGPSVAMSSGGLSAIIGGRVTMPKLARTISRFGSFDRPIVDQTGLEGEFDVVVLASSDIPGATADARFLTAMREQLGLTLRSGQGTREVLRIRHLEQASSN